MKPGIATSADQDSIPFRQISLGQRGPRAAQKLGGEPDVRIP
jgi:hypothetical protein